MFGLIDRESSINPFDESGERLDQVQGTIEIDGVCFSYPSRPDVTVLNDFTLKIPKGKVTALVVSPADDVFVSRILTREGTERIWKEYRNWSLGTVV